MLGDVNGDGKVDVSDLGILAANYGITDGATWAAGDFNGDGKVDVGDLGILAANYGTGANATLDFNADYARAFGATIEENSGDEGANKQDEELFSTMGCSGIGLPLAGSILLTMFMIGKVSV